MIKNNKFVDILGTILLLIGFFLAFLPHAVHIAVGLDDGKSHTKHVVYGMILVVIALGILVYNNDSWKFKKST